MGQNAKIPMLSCEFVGEVEIFSVFSFDSAVKEEDLMALLNQAVLDPEKYISLFGDFFNGYEVIENVVKIVKVHQIESLFNVSIEDCVAQKEKDCPYCKNSKGIYISSIRTDTAQGIVSIPAESVVDAADMKKEENLEGFLYYAGEMANTERLKKAIVQYGTTTDCDFDERPTSFMPLQIWKVT